MIGICGVEATEMKLTMIATAIEENLGDFAGFLGNFDGVAIPAAGAGTPERPLPTHLGKVVWYLYIC